ncbi:MAG: sulfotransferase family protein [Acidimicrobiales bacterium]
MALVFDDEISNGAVTPIVLLGAPRSGTQMYRDMICSHPAISTWPYNEMTYMWRYGNRSYPTDEIPVELLTPKIARYIRDSFIKLSRKSGSPMVVDKTCHNCLRPEYVRAVLPEAKYIYLIRHAMDVVPSTVKRSESPPPAREYSRVLSIPPGDLLHYVGKALWNHGGLIRPGKRSVRVWGPKFEGMNELAATRPVQEVSAFQWLRHMELTDRFLDGDGFDSPLLRVRYEEITEDPSTALHEVFDFLGVDTPQSVVDRWIGEVNYRPPGGGGHLLGEFEDSVGEIVADKNAEHGYARDRARANGGKRSG